MKEDRSSNVDTEIMDGLGERAAAVVLDGFVEEIKKAEVCHLSENLFRHSRVFSLNIKAFVCALVSPSLLYQGLDLLLQAVRCAGERVEGGHVVRPVSELSR